MKFFVVRESETTYGFLRVEVQPTSALKNDPPQPTAKSLDEWLVILRNDCDRQQVISAARGVTSQATAADAERAMSALLAAAEFVDISDQAQVSVVQELMQTMRKLDHSGKTLAIVRVLRDGPTRSRQFAINSVGPFKNITTDKEFPALAEQVLIVAAGEDLWPRVIALGLLGETLAVTKLDPAAVSTEERREMGR